MQKRSFRSLSVVSLSAVVIGCSAQPSATRACRGTQAQPLNAPAPAQLFLTSAVLARLQARASAGDPAWLALKKECDAYTTGTVYAPDGPAYANYNDVGQGYQGGGYTEAVRALGLCYRTMKGVDDAAAARYATTGTAVLSAMSTPPASGGQPPSTDSGYGIRNYGVGMALGYDWFAPALSSGLKTRLITALDSWIDWYDQNGFIRNEPIGNYFVGYLVAKTYTAIVTAPDNPKAQTYWSDVQTRLWGTVAEPAYAAYLKGGGWPEGWQYGPLAVRRIAELLWALKTSKNLDWYRTLPQVSDQARYIEYFAWPSLTRMNDEGMIHSGADVAPSAALFTSLATILKTFGDPRAPVAAAFARDVLGKIPDDRAAWEKFLYWDPAAAQGSYKTQPLSYVASGPENAAMRSGWDTGATWLALSGGPYIDAPDSGEQTFDAGGLAVVSGGSPVLVNATGWIPKTAGTPGEDFVYTDSWGGGGRRLYNTFFVDDPGSPYSPGQNLAGPQESKAHLERYEDGGAYVRVRAAKLEDQYGVGGGHPVVSYTRDLVYLRPSTVVLYDRTVIASASADHWMAFHTSTAPTEVSLSDPSQHRYDVTSSGKVLGSLRLLFPKGTTMQTVALPGGTTRIEEHATGAAQQWLSTVTVGASVPDETRLSAGDGNVLSGGALGVEVHSAVDQIVLFPAAAAAGSQLSSAQYVIASSAISDHVLVDVTPSSSGYAVSTQAGSGGLVVTVTPGGPLQVSAAGVLSFQVSSSGAVTPLAAPPTGGGSGTGGTNGTGTGGTNGTGTGGTNGTGTGGTNAGGSSSGGGSSTSSGGNASGGSLPPCP